MKKFFCNGKKGFCDTDICNDCDFADNSGGEYREVPVTNADRIRAMSDEELAAWISGLLVDCAKCEGCDRSLCWKEPCLKWLQQQAEEE